MALAAAGAATLLVAYVGLMLRARWEARAWDAWFAGAAIPEIHLRLDDGARASLASRPRVYVRGEFEHEGWRHVVGVRLKGHRSMRPLGEKPSIKIAFDRYDDRTFRGARRLTLNGMVEDPTLLREFLGYRVFQALGVASPRAGYASVFVDGENYGIYAMIESTEGVLRRSGPAQARRVVYEGEYGCDLHPEDVPGFEREHGKDPGRSALRALADAAQGEGQSLFDAAAGPLEVRSFLRFLAASAVIGDFDGYGHSHNYRLLFEPSNGKWQLMPWGLDRAFERRLDIFDSEGWLAKRCFADRVCRLEYVRTARSVIDSFESMPLVATARALIPMLDVHQPPSASLPQDARRAAEKRRALEQFIRQRPAEVRRQLTCIDDGGNELDRDGDGHGCMDCNDADANVGPHGAERCDGIDNDCSGIADDAAACPCVSREIAGRVYHFCDRPMPWREAERHCIGQGLVLARIESASDSRALYAEARRINRAAWWIGYSDREREGQFVWREGDVGGFTHWDKGQPNNRSCNEDCVALRERGRGRWHDTPCHQHRPFICAAQAAGVRDAAPGLAAE